MRRAIPLVALAAACAGAEDKKPVAVDAIPTVMVLHQTAIARSCSPNPGVCHQANNYPDLRTPGSLLALVDAPCNLEIPDPTQGWDACEPRADWLELYGLLDDPESAAPLLTTDVAWRERVGTGRWRVGLRDAPAESGRALVTLGRDEVRLYPEPGAVFVETTAGVPEVTIVAEESADPEESPAELVDAVLETTAGGDPNRNGRYGADEAMHGRLIAPGAIDASYLFGRVTGTVPGTRMPLANQPLSDAEYTALACWIEGLVPGEAPGLDDPIDYDNCDYAASGR